MPKVSVIIPTFNRADKLSRAVSSVLNQSFTDFELIVVDDGSTDQTTRVMAPFRSQVVYLRFPFNQGVSAARNLGLQKASSSLIAFLDSDDYWLPQKLAVQVDFFDRHPEAQICQTEEIWIRKGRRVNPRKKHLKPSGDIFAQSLKLCLISPSAVMLRRTLFDEVGGFDEDLPACEDYDLWLRIACRCPVHLIPEPLVVKEGGMPDQLSAKVKGMDRFRIRAIEKLIKQGVLNKTQFEAAMAVLAEKCKIYGQGCLKRGKIREGTYYLNLPQRLKEELS